MTNYLFTRNGKTEGGTCDQVNIGIAETVLCAFGFWMQPYDPFLEWEDLSAKLSREQFSQMYNAGVREFELINWNQEKTILKIED